MGGQRVSFTGCQTPGQDLAGHRAATHRGPNRRRSSPRTCASILVACRPPSGWTRDAGIPTSRFGLPRHGSSKREECPHEECTHGSRRRNNVRRRYAGRMQLQRPTPTGLDRMNPAEKDALILQLFDPLEKRQRRVEELEGQSSRVKERRQPRDSLPAKIHVTEFRQYEVECACGQCHRREFPAGISPNVSDGPRIKADAVCLIEGQLVGLQRTAEILGNRYGVSPSASTLPSWMLQASVCLNAS